MKRIVNIAIQKPIKFILIIVLFFSMPQLLWAGILNSNPENQIPYTIKNLTDGSRLDVYPNFSPDGKKIVFSSKPSESGEVTLDGMHLWIMDASGKNRHRITSGKGRYLFPTFTYGSEKVIFVSDREDGMWNLWSCKVDGSDITRLTSIKTGFRLTPHVSPDGNHILFISKEEMCDSSVHIMGIDGSNLRRVTSGGSGDYFPTMSPDGQEIFFASSRLGKGDIWAINIKTNTYRRLSFKNNMEAAPSVSRDGKKIAYRAKPGGEYESFDDIDEKINVYQNIKSYPVRGGVFDIWLMDKDGTNKMQLTYNRSIKNMNRVEWAMTATDWNLRLYQLSNYAHLSWHPDGDKIALSDWNPTENKSFISVIEFDKDLLQELSAAKEQLPEYTLIGEKELTKGDWDDFAPHFSPDGEDVIVFASNKSGNWDIWRLSVADDEKQEQLTKSLDDEIAPVFSPDSKSIAYLKRKKTSDSYDIWVMKSDGVKSEQITRDISVLSYPAWSPDGKEIAFVSESTEGIEIWIHNVSDHTQKKILDNSVASLPGIKMDRSRPFKEFLFKEAIYRVDYNRIGDKIVFESNRKSNVDIWTMDISTKNLSRITNGQLPHWNPVFNPNNEKMAYATQKATRSWQGQNWPDYDIWLADAESGKKMRLTGEEQFDWNPAWSKDGKRIAYVTNRSGNFDHFSIWMLYLK